MSVKFVLTEDENKRLTSEAEGSILNAVASNIKEDAISKKRGYHHPSQVKFPDRRSYQGPERTIEC